MTTAAYREKNREQIREKERLRREANPEKIREQKRESASKHRHKRVDYQKQYKLDNVDRLKQLNHERYLRKKYGISQEEKNALLIKYNYVCAACGEGGKLVIDHCHTTGHIRGILCDSCNRALGHAKENPERLRKLADWIENCGAI